MSAEVETMMFVGRERPWHSKEIVTVDVYADKTVLAYDVLAETEDYFKSLLPDEEESCREDILNIVIDVSPYLLEE